MAGIAIKMTLAEEEIFSNRDILKELEAILENSYLQFSVRNPCWLDNDIVKFLEGFSNNQKPA